MPSLAAPTRQLLRRQLLSSLSRPLSRPLPSCLTSSRPFSQSALTPSAAAATASDDKATIISRIKERDAVYEQQVLDAKAELVKLGYDEASLWTQVICWGDHDQFQHVNNCHFVRFVESARMRFAEVLAQDFENEQERIDVLRGTGESFILGNISVRYRRPVVYPDTLIVGSSPLLPLSSDRFTLRSTYYSIAQKAIVATSDQLCVTYDYRKLSKCPMPQRFRVALEKRGKEE